MDRSRRQLTWLDRQQHCERQTEQPQLTQRIKIGEYRLAVTQHTFKENTANSLKIVYDSELQVSEFELLGRNLGFRSQNMNRISLTIAVLALLATTLNAGDGDWQVLFNGKDLTGWQANVHPESFTVTDGVLKAHGINGMAHLFYVGDDKTDDAFVNFELSATVRSEPNSNSGIFFHTDRELRKKKYLNKGYEVQLNSSAIEKRKTGSLYFIHDLAESPVDETEWFEIRFRVEAKRIQVFLNDEKTVDYTEPENPVRPAARAKRLIDPQGGAIALQAHDPKSVFFFKKIRIRKLENHSAKR